MSDMMYFRVVLPIKNKERAVLQVVLQFCERGPRQTKTSSERATNNVRPAASALVSILVSRLAFCLGTRSDARGPLMGIHARRLLQLVTVDDRP